ncbi:MAG: arylesterase [Methyloprofundus sp.]|nr:arylesterase [Methyloprofundus sp.]
MKNIFVVIATLLVMSCSQTEPQYKKLSENAVILAFGDSLTYGTGATVGNSYPELLSKLSGHAVVNAGIPGEISEHGLRRLPALLDQHQPELLVLIHGANDILRKLPLDKARSNLAAMVTLAQQRQIQVLLLGVPSFNILFLNSAPFYNEVASTYHVPIDLDTLSDVISQSSLKSDQIHPNDAGYAVMAENIYQLLLKEGAL